MKKLKCFPSSLTGLYLWQLHLKQSDIPLHTLQDMKLYLYDNIIILLYYSAQDLISIIIQQKSAGYTCPYCRCDIRGTETILIEPYLPGSGQLDGEGEEDTEDDDHEDIEVMVKEMAALKKVCESIYAYACFCNLFLAMLVYGNVGLSHSSTLVQTEISQQISDGLL